MCIVPTYWRKILIKFRVLRKLTPTKWKQQKEITIAANSLSPYKPKICARYIGFLNPKKLLQPSKVVKFSWYRRRNRDSDVLSIFLKVISLVSGRAELSPDLPDPKPTSQCSVYQTVVSKFFYCLHPPIENKPYKIKQITTIIIKYHLQYMYGCMHIYMFYIYVCLLSVIYIYLLTSSVSVPLY